MTKINSNSKIVSCFGGTLLVVLLIIILFPCCDATNDYDYYTQFSSSPLRGIISGAISGKGKTLAGGVKAGNEFTRVSADPEIAKITGGFAGFG